MFLIFLFAQVLKIKASVVPDESDKQVKEFEMPEYLNGNTFNAQVSTKLTVVEFFSPYCSHCKTLAPIWKEAVEDFISSGSDIEYQIDFRQVDCVQSGDICRSEVVKAYPSIRLYGPDIEEFDKEVGVVSKNHLKNYPDDFDRSKEDFIKFAQLESLNYYSAAKADLPSDTGGSEEHLESASKQTLLNSDDLISIISDIDVSTGEEMKDNEKTWLVAFFNEDSQKLENQWWSGYHYFKDRWISLGEELHDYGAKQGAFNCHKSKSNGVNIEICKELVDMTQPFPQLVVITPKKKINKIFRYDDKQLGEFTNEKIVDFVLRVHHNSYIPQIAEIDLNSFLFLKSSKTGTLYRGEKIYVVFQYDEETVTSEDFDFLEHLISPLSNIPNCYLYQTAINLEKYNLKLVSKLDNAFNRQNFVNSFTETMASNKLLSQVPTFHIYKENTLVPNTFRCFSTVELRDLDLVLDWIYRDSLPAIVNLDDENAEFIFNHIDYDQVVILFTNPAENDVKVSLMLDDYRKNYEAYELTRWNYNYELLNSERKAKEDKISRLKDEVTGSDKSVLFKEMKKEIMLHEYEKRTIFMVLDLDKYPLTRHSFIHEALKGYNRLWSLKANDILIIDNGYHIKNRVTVYDSAIFYDVNEKNLLTYSGFSIANTLSYVNFGVQLFKQSVERKIYLDYDVISPNAYFNTGITNPFFAHKIIVICIYCLLIALVIVKLKKKMIGKMSNVRYVLKTPSKVLFFLHSFVKNGKLAFSKFKSK
ncbi:hypothetical protein QEN19_004123 [Hanseniaspora menglaensis]